MIELSHLRVFHAVVRANGISRAQKELGVRQPAISKALRKLESQLGVALLERSQKGVVLTPAGQRLMVSCEAVLREVDGLEHIAEEERGSLRGDLKIATQEHIATYLLPPAVAALRRDQPGVVPRLFTGPAHLMVREIADGRHELGFFFYVEKSNLLERRELKKFPCQLVVAKGRAKDPAVLTSFIGSREVDDVGNKSFPTLQMLVQQRPETSIRLSSNSLEAHKALVRAGCGISILPRFAVEQELKDGSFELLHPDYVYQATLEVVTKRGKILSRQAKAFLRQLRAVL